MNAQPSAPLPLSAVRAVALHAQGLTTPNGAEPPPTLDALARTIEQVTCLQIDTLQMVRRSHYVTLWSRLGGYDPADLDRLVYDPAERRAFEYWLHAASIIPLRAYRYRLPEMARFHDGAGWWPDWIKNPDNAALVERVLERVRAEGPVRAADFEHDGAARGPWWDWKPAKSALEHLYNCGELMVTDRVNFQRVYDVPERVLPDWVDRTPPTRDEADRCALAQSARALGLGSAGHVADYTWMKRGGAAPRLAELLAEGALIEVPVETLTGVETWLAHRDNLPLLAQAADGAIPTPRTTFLNPFDSLLWPRGRDQQVWGFRQVLEAYKPARDRIWGYYCLSILHGDRLVGRFDPKLERKQRALRLKALYLEPGVAPGDALIAAVAGALRDFLAWHGAHELIVERSDPPAFGEALLAAL